MRHYGISKHTVLNILGENWWGPPEEPVELLAFLQPDGTLSEAADLDLELGKAILEEALTTRLSWGCIVFIVVITLLVLGAALLWL